MFAIVSEYILLFTVLKMLNPKHSSFVCRLNRWSSAAQNFGHPRGFGLLAVIRRKPQRPTAPGKRLRPNAAARCGEQRQSRGCRAFALKRRRGGRQEEGWPGTQRQGPEIESPTWGTSKSCSGLRFREKTCIFSKCLGKVWLSNLNVRQMLGSMITCSV